MWLRHAPRLPPPLPPLRRRRPPTAIAWKLEVRVVSIFLVQGCQWPTRGGVAAMRSFPPLFLAKCSLAQLWRLLQVSAPCRAPCRGKSTQHCAAFSFLRAQWADLLPELLPLASPLPATPCFFRLTSTGPSPSAHRDSPPLAGNVVGRTSPCSSDSSSSSACATGKREVKKDETEPSMVDELELELELELDELDSRTRVALLLLLLDIVDAEYVWYWTCLEVQGQGS